MEAAAAVGGGAAGTTGTKKGHGADFSDVVRTVLGSTFVAAVASAARFVGYATTTTHANVLK
jgi:hypothetical protein